MTGSQLFTAITSLTLWVFAIVVWVPLGFKTLRKRRAARKAAQERAALEPLIKTLGAHLRETLRVDCTATRLTPIARSGWTTGDLDRCYAAVDNTPEYLPLILNIAYDSSALALADGPALDPEGVAYWARIGYLNIDSDMSLPRSREIDFKTGMNRMKDYAHVGDHTFSAWAYAAGMSTDEAPLHKRDGVTLDQLRTLAALLDHNIDIPTEPLETTMR